MSDSNQVTLSKDVLYGIVILVLAGALMFTYFSYVNKQCPVCNVQNGSNNGNNNNGNNGNNGNTGTTSAPKDESLAVDVGNLPMLGNANAPVKIVEFSDYQCPYCGAFEGGNKGAVAALKSRDPTWEAAAPLIKSNYVNSGKVAFYFRDFPLTSIHPKAVPGAIAARCANDQGKFWEMNTKLFANQETWSATSFDHIAEFKKYAKELGLDEAKFNNCLDTQQHVDAINADEQVGIGYGVQGTPGVFIILPKNKVNKDSLKLQKGTDDGTNYYWASEEGFRFYENSDTYVLFVAGAYPYSSIDSVLKKVTY